MRHFALLVSLLLTLALSACKPEQAAAPTGPVIPSTDLDSEWKTFVEDIAKSKRIKGKTKGIYLRFFGAMDDPTPHLKDTQNIFNRGVEPGSLLVFGSNNSRNMADLLVTALNLPGIDGKLNGSRLLFVGAREDEAQVREASAKSGVTFEFYPTN
jgi:hypothetical protein